jgi:hypothetical protein
MCSYIYALLPVVYVVAHAVVCDYGFCDVTTAPGPGPGDSATDARAAVPIMVAGPVSGVQHTLSADFCCIIMLT